MLAAEKSKDTFIAPIGIGISLFVIEIAGVNYTGASVNPARSFGPCVASADFPGYHWIYWLGPALGALVAGGFFHFIKVGDYDIVLRESMLTCCSSSITRTPILDKTALAQTRISMESLSLIWRTGATGLGDDKQTATRLTNTSSEASGTPAMWNYGLLRIQ
jgi:hypothetical protein